MAKLFEESSTCAADPDWATRIADAAMGWQRRIVVTGSGRETDSVPGQI